MTAYDDFLADPRRIDVYLVETEPYDPVGLAVVNRYDATGPFTSASTDTPASQRYSARATVALNAQQDAQTPGTVRSVPSVTGGEIVLGMRYGDLDDDAAYVWDGRPATVIHTGYSKKLGRWLTRAEGTVVYSGEIAAVRHGLGELTLELRSPAARLAHPISESPLLGLPWWYSFNGATDGRRFTYPTAPTKYSITDDLTVEGVVRVRNLPGTEAALVTFQGGTTWPWGVWIDSSGHLVLKDSTGALWTSTATLSAGVRYKFAIALDATSLYFELFNLTTGTLTTETDATDYTGRPGATGSPAFYVGSSGAGSYFDGHLAWIRFRSTKLTPSVLADVRFRRMTEAEAITGALKGLIRLDDGDAGTAQNVRAVDASDSAATPAPDPAAAATGNKFTRASGSFVTDGWEVGMLGKSQGFSNAANNGYFTVSTVDATNLAVTGLTLVDEAASIGAVYAAPLLGENTTGSGHASVADGWEAALEGAPDIAGTLKPVAYGRCESVPLVLVSLAKNIYLVAGNKCSAVNAAYIGGVTLEQDAATYTNLATFLAATTTAGMYDALICDDGTFVRFGATPGLIPTADVYGDATGSGYVETAATIARRIVTTRGPEPLVDPTELDTASFTALDSANSAPCGVYARGDDNIEAVTAFILGSVGASGYIFPETGKFTVTRFGGVTGSSSYSIDERHILNIEPLGVELPFYAVSLGYRKQYTTLTTDQIAGDLLDQDADILTRLLVGILYARVEDSTIRDLHPRSVVYARETGLALEEDAIAEAQRVLPIVGGAATAFRVVARSSALVGLALLDIVTVAINDRSRSGASQQRLGLGAGTDFVVLGIAPVLADGTVELTIWKGGS